MSKKHETINDLNCTIDILRPEYKKYLVDFESGKDYPEKQLGDYVKKDAFDEMESGDGVSYVVLRSIDDKTQEMVAYFTLVASAIPIMYRIEDEEDVPYEAMCGIPAVRVHMFAINDKYQDVFYLNKPIAAWVFEAMINIIDEKSKNDMGIKAIYLHALPNAKQFYKRNKMIDAEEYMIPFAGMDDDLDVMYVAIREISNTYQKTKKKLSFWVRWRKRLGRYLLRD